LFTATELTTSITKESYTLMVTDIWSKCKHYK